MSLRALLATGPDRQPRRHPGATPLPLLIALACTPRAPLPPPPSPDIVEMSVGEAGRLMASRQLSAAALTAAHLDRIAAIDDAGPRINAVIALNPEALADAARLDAERAAGRVRGPLHGVPVLIKDNIDVAGMVTSAGSLALAGHRRDVDAPLVARLREAGVVILGKTNLSEWANMRSTRSISGWSSLGGLTLNPYALDHNPCGSSSGTGAAVAASLAIVGVGTETDGSILCPSAMMGLVGLKPTFGQIPGEGVVPISLRQDTAGPMARSVADAAVLWAALAGRPVPALEDGLRGRRVGVLRGATGYNAALDATFEAALARLGAAGVTVVDPLDLPTWGQWDEPSLEMLLCGFSEDLGSYLKKTGAPVDSLEALIAYDEEHASTVMPWFGQELFELARDRGPADGQTCSAARERARRLAWDEGLKPAFARVDLLVAPTTGPAWVTDLSTPDAFEGAGYSVAAVAGTPSLTVPMGELDGLPVGLTLMGPPEGEPALLAAGAAFEAATRARRPPTYRGTAPQPPSP